MPALRPAIEIMIDLHSHILPAVDDGARDFETAVAMCHMAAADGCQAIVATPHLRHERWWNGDRALLQQRLDELQDRVGDHLKLYLGGEIAIHTESFDEILEQPDNVVSLAGSRYLLLELDWQGLGPTPESLFFEIGLADWRVVIAHPERVSWLMQDQDLIHRLVANGAMTQITAMSLTGDLGKMAQDASYWLLENGLAHFVASDCHDMSRRLPGLTKAHQEVSKIWGDDMAQELFVDNPQAVLENRPLGPGGLSGSAGVSHGSLLGV